MVETKVTPTPATYKLIVLEKDKEMIQSRIDAIWEAKKGDLALKGFRRGQVPRELAENKIGFENLYEDLLNEILRSGLQEATPPTPIIGIGNVAVQKFAPNQPILLEAEVWLEPTVDLTTAPYKGLVVNKQDTDVADSEVDAIIQKARYDAAMTKTVVREAANGDVVTFDFVGKTADGTVFEGGSGEDYELILGSSTFLPDFETQLFGFKAGEVKTISLNFPEDYPSDDLKGQPVTFDVTMKRVDERTVPELDEDFAKQMNFDSVEEYVADTRSALEKNKEQHALRQTEHEIFSLLASSVGMDPIPEVMINDQVQSIIQNTLSNLRMKKEEYLKRAETTEEQLAQQHRPAALTDIRVRLILNAIAKAEGLAPEDKDRQRWVDMARSQFDKDATDEEILGQLNVSLIDRNIRIEKASDFVKAEAVFKEPEATQVTQAQQHKCQGCAEDCGQAEETDSE